MVTVAENTGFVNAKTGRTKCRCLLEIITLWCNNTLLQHYYIKSIFDK
jgi:hypothetical protein